MSALFHQQTGEPSCVLHPTKDKLVFLIQGKKGSDPLHYWCLLEQKPVHFIWDKSHYVAAAALIIY